MLCLYALCLSLNAISGKGVEQGWWPYGTSAKIGTTKDFLGTRHSLLYQYVISFARPRVSVFSRTHTYLTAYRLYMNYRCYQTTLQWNIFKQIGSSAKCWLDIYHWGAGLAVTGRIRDIGQNVERLLLKQEAVAAQLMPHFETWSSSSPVTATFWNRKQ
jgi:hypothetical protein